jgi:hypothetical protein
LEKVRKRNKRFGGERMKLKFMIISILASTGMIMSVAIALKNSSITNSFYVLFYFILYTFMFYQTINERNRIDKLSSKQEEKE